MLTAVFRRMRKPNYSRNSFKFSAIRLTTRNNSNVITSAFPDVEVPNLTVHELVFRDFHKYPDKIAVECAVTGKKYTFEELRRKADNLNKSLRKKLKLNKGDVIAILLPNVPEFPICVLGALKASLIVTTINPSYTAHEIKRQLVDSNSKALITLTTSHPLAKASITLANISIPILTIKTQESEALPENSLDLREFTDVKCDIEDAPPCDINDTAFLPYSSGTTGLPKGVLLSHYNLVANLCQLTHPHFKLAFETTEIHQDVVPGVLPWFHIYGFSSVMLTHIFYLCKVVALPKFTTESFVTTLIKHKPHLLFIVPPIVIFMNSHSSVKTEHLQVVRTIFSGAAPLGILDEQKLLDKAQKHINVLQGYGLTETSPGVLLIPPAKKRQLKISGTVGEVLPNTTLKVVSADDPLGEGLGVNRPGELLIKGPQVTKGYLNRPEETKNSFIDGWFKTGDLVYYDSNKLFYVADRLKELIKVKGFQVAPAELEEILRDHPEVDDAAVIGVPHEINGEAPRAYVVLKPKSKLSAGKLNDFVSEKVAKFKKLTGGIAFVESIPKNASGKILRRQLKLEYEQCSSK